MLFWRSGVNDIEPQPVSCEDLCQMGTLAQGCTPREGLVFPLKYNFGGVNMLFWRSGVNDIKPQPVSCEDLCQMGTLAQGCIPRKVFGFSCKIQF